MQRIGNMDTLPGFIGTAAEFLGLAGLLAGGIGGVSLVLVYLFVRDRVNPFKKAKAHLEKGHERRALALIGVELHRNPSNRTALLLRADIERSHGLHAEAEQDYYRLIDLKRQGDGIDILDMKRKLLQPLYRQGKLHQTFTLAREVFSEAKSDPEALYYAGLIYLGQLYYGEAWRIFRRLVLVRPKRPDVLLGASVALIQLKEYEKAIELLKRALEFDDDPVCRLVFAVALYLLGSYRDAVGALEAVRWGVGKGARGEAAVGSKTLRRFATRIGAFLSLKLGEHEEALEGFSALLAGAGPRADAAEIVKKADVTPEAARSPKGMRSSGMGAKGTTVIYNRFGRIEDPKTTPPVSGARMPAAASGRQPAEGEKPPFADYFRIKEIAREEGKWPVDGGAGEDPGRRFLDIEGLSPRTWDSLDFGLSLVKMGRLSEARAHFEEAARRHPELLGIRRLISLIEEKEKETGQPGAQRSPASRPGAEAGLEAGEGEAVSERTRRVIGRKGRRYELWEYIEAWEESGIRPYHVLLASGLAAKSRLNPRLLFTESGQLALDI